MTRGLGGIGVLKLIENWFKVARLIIEEALDDLFASDFTENVQYTANSVGDGYKALLEGLLRG